MQLKKAIPFAAAFALGAAIILAAGQRLDDAVQDALASLGPYAAALLAVVAFAGFVVVLAFWPTKKNPAP